MLINMQRFIVNINRNDVDDADDDDDDDDGGPPLEV